MAVRRVGLRLVWALVAAVLTGLVPEARAQDGVWVQIEARPTLALAEQRIREYTGQIDGLAGFRLRNGWYAVAIGPFSRADAAEELARLRGLGLVPRDSFLVEGSGYSDQFWPVGAPREIGVTPLADPSDDAAQGTGAIVEPAAAPVEETVEEARLGERLLSREQREDVQRALGVLGYYTSTIDGAFGPGTRRAMAAWQADQGFEATGVLTTAQREALVGGLREARESLGMQLVSDPEAGIEIELPLAEVSFSAYEAPFARYDGEKAQVLLISQSGDLNTLRGLYDVMKTLEIMPLEGPREIKRGGFRLSGENDTRASYAYATVTDGTVKGFALIWPAGDELRRKLALDQMQASFRPIKGVVLPDTAGEAAIQRPDLLAGLKIRQPDVSVSGFYVDTSGSVVTANSMLDGCARITVGEVDASIAATDPALDLALLQPREPLSPLGIGRLSAAVPRLHSEIAVAGYSYGGLLGAPTISFGTLEDLKGLNGDAQLSRLALNALPGDAGGPVLGSGGGVLGMLLPRGEDTSRALPSEVHFAANAEAIAAFLANHGVSLASAPGDSSALAPEDLALIGADMTVQVACWN